MKETTYTRTEPVHFVRYRLRNGLSQQALADEIGVTVDVVRHMERGGRPRGESLVKVAKHFDVDPLVQWPPPEDVAA